MINRADANATQLKEKSISSNLYLDPQVYPSILEKLVLELLGTTYKKTIMKQKLSS